MATGANGQQFLLCLIENSFLLIVFCGTCLSKSQLHHFFYQVINKIKAGNLFQSARCLFHYIVPLLSPSVIQIMVTAIVGWLQKFTRRLFMNTKPTDLQQISFVHGLHICLSTQCSFTLSKQLILNWKSKRDIERQQILLIQSLPRFITIFN